MPRAANRVRIDRIYLTVGGQEGEVARTPLLGIKGIFHNPNPEREGGDPDHRQEGSTKEAQLGIDQSEGQDPIH